MVRLETSQTGHLMVQTRFEVDVGKVNAQPDLLSTLFGNTGIQ